MSDTVTKTETKRKSKWFWAIDDFYNVVQVLGYECPPNDKVWWVPALGYSLNEDYHLFDTAKVARQKAIEKVESNIADLQSALNRLKSYAEKQLDEIRNCDKCDLCEDHHG